MKNNKTSYYLSFLLIITLLVTGCGKKIEIKDGSKVAVSTKDGKITATEYYDEIKKNNISELVDMIDHQLFDKKYKKDKEEDESIEKQISQIKSNYGSEEATFNSVIKQYFGVNNEDELEKMLRLEYKRNKAVEEYIEKKIKDDEIEKYYEENVTGDIKASLILIKTSVKSDATSDEKTEAEKKAKEKAEKVIKKLNKGEDFSKLAKQYSDDEGPADKGGDLGYFGLYDMVDGFSKAVKELKKDEYTKEPIKTEYGYHIILKTGEKEKPKLKDAKKEIKEKLREQKLTNDPSLHYQTLIDIREENKISWNDDELKKQYKELMDQLIKRSSANNAAQ